MEPVLALLAAALAALLVLWRRQLALKREAYIRAAELPRGLFDALRKRHPSLSLKDCQVVAHALRRRRRFGRRRLRRRRLNARRGCG